MAKVMSNPAGEDVCDQESAALVPAAVPRQRRDPMNELERDILAFFTDHYDYGVISDALAKRIAHDLAGVLVVRVLSPTDPR